MRFSTVVLFAAAAMASKMPDHEYEESSSEAPVPTSEYEDKPKGHGKHKTTSTVYETTTYTITDCPETVTKCPHDKTKVVTETISVSTTVCDAEEETESTWPTYSHEYPNQNKTWPHKSYPPEETSTVGNHPTYPTEKPEPECPYTKVKTISTSYTTVVPTVIYETYTEECAKSKPTEPSKAAYPSSEAGCGGYNCSSPAKPAESSKPITAGAASTVGSVVFAAAAGLAAYVLA